MSLPRPAAGEVHVWTAPLRVDARTLSAYRAVLAPDEIARAERIVVPEKRTQSIVSRGALRLLIGRYLARPAARLEFAYGPHGRPALRPAEPGLAFNVSHSGDVAVLAFAAGIEIGVDVERVRDDVDFLGVGRRFFSAREHADLSAADVAARPLAFFRCWTRKESYLKARGSGLALPLAEFDVTLLDARPRLLATRFDPADAARWSLTEIVPRPGYVGTLCASPGARAVRLMGDAAP